MDQYPHNEQLLLNNKKERLIGTCNNLDASPGHYAGWEKPIWKGFIDIIQFMEVPK